MFLDAERIGACVGESRCRAGSLRQERRQPGLTSEVASAFRRRSITGSTSLNASAWSPIPRRLSPRWRSTLSLSPLVHPAANLSRRPRLALLGDRAYLYCYIRSYGDAMRLSALTHYYALPREETICMIDTYIDTSPEYNFCSSPRAADSYQ